MSKIVKVVIKGTSGYCSIDDAYEEKITITSSKIKYHYLPELLKNRDRCDIEAFSSVMPEIKFSTYYGPNFIQRQFEEIADLALATLNRNDIEECCDIGGTEITVFYDNGTKMSNTYYTFRYSFCTLLEAVKRLFKVTGLIPEMLKTEDMDIEE